MPKSFVRFCGDLTAVVGSQGAERFDRADGEPTTAIETPVISGALRSRNGGAGILPNQGLGRNAGSVRHAPLGAGTGILPNHFALEQKSQSRFCSTLR